MLEEHCPKITRCPMFPLFRNEGALRVMQISFCEGEFKRCERYKLTSTGKMPDPALLPNGRRLKSAVK